MSWRGQGGRRAKGRRGDQDPELDNTAWLAELEREAAARGDDEDEDDWASTLRGRRSTGPAPAAPGPPPPGPSWAPDPGPPPPDDRSYGSGADGAGTPQGPGGDATYEPGRTAYGSDAWSADPAPRDRPLNADPGPPVPPPPDPDPDWSWRPPAPDAYGEPGGTAPAAPAPEAFGNPRPDAGSGTDWGGSQTDPEESWRSAGVDTPTGTWEPVEPVGREPDYPALFGELYRRSAGQQDPIWEAPPATEPPPPEQAPPDPQPASWPFEETTQSWEPTDGSFIWPADELPSTSAEWNTPAPPSWLDDPGAGAGPPPSAHPATPAFSEPDLDPTAAWSSPWADQPDSGNGVPPAPTGPPPATAPPTGQPFASPGPAVVPPGPPPVVPPGPPPADWASAIPTDVPAARRAADPASTRGWRPDEAVEAEPGVPLGPGSRPAGEGAASRMARLRGPAGEGAGSRTSGLPPAAGQTPASPMADPGPAYRDPVSRAFGTRAADRAVPVPDTEPDEEPRSRRRNRQAGERQVRAWPRIVAVISWIVLVMVVCWFYVFPWLERVLPENF
jgi:hypothetical protein